MNDTKPNYKKIFEDMIAKNCPDRRNEFSKFLNKDHLPVMDVIKLSAEIFKKDNKDTLIFNQGHKSYDEEAIITILQYQEKENLNNTQVANHFKLSRNTVAKWKKQYSQCIEISKSEGL